MNRLMRHGVWTVILTLLTWTIALTVDQKSNNITTLHFLLIAPFPDPVFKPAYDDGHSLIPSGLLAVDEINRNSSILDGYHLEAIVGDGGCTFSNKAVSRVLENVIHRGPQHHIIGIVGPACSEAARTLSELMNRNRLKLPIVTFANSPVLANVSRYPFTYGIVSTSEEYAEAVVTLYKAMYNAGKWRNISLFYDANRLYHREIYRGVLNKLETEGFSLDSVYASPISPTYMPLEDIRMSGIRVAFVFSSKEPACMLVCRAIYLGMTHTTFQFFFTDRTLSHFQSCVNESITRVLNFTYNSRVYLCTNDEIVKALNNFIHFSFILEGLSLEPDTTRAVSGNTFSEYREKYEQWLFNYNHTVEGELRPTPWAAPFYDAVWALALAANKTLPKLNFHSQLDIWDPDQLTQTFDELRFRGISTMVDFDPNTGFCDSIIGISRFEYNATGNEIITVLKGYYDLGRLFDSSNHNSSDEVLSLYINSAFDVSTEALPLGLALTGYVLATLVLIATITYHVLHFYYRNKPSLKAASPQLNHFIFLGCYIILASVILDTTDVGFSPENTSRHLQLCYAVIWLENIGVTLVFSTLFVKYYRLYLVFLRTYDHRSNLSNGKLSLIVMVMVCIEVAILAIWTPFKPLQIDTTVAFDHSSEPPVNREKKICIARNVGTWFPITTSLYLAVLILAVVTLSILNRRIKQRDFNTTATTNILVYLYILLLSILLPSVYIESNYGNIDLKYGIINSVYLIFTVLCLVFLFTPPLLMKKRKNRKYSFGQQLQKISSIIALSRIQHVTESVGKTQLSMQNRAFV